jgi:hypothetical protein
VGFDEDNQKDVVLQIARFVVFVITECDRIKAEWDNNNNASELDTSPIVPHDLVKVVLRHFISDVLNLYRAHLDRFWSEKEIDKIEAEQLNLIMRYNNDQHIK